MKKFLVVLLTLVVCGGVFAQWKPTVTIDLRPELLYMASPTGEGAQTKSDYHTAATDYKGAGTFDFLTHGSYYGSNDAGLEMTYTGEEGQYSAYLKLNLSPLFAFNTAASAAPTQTTGGFFSPAGQFTVDRVFSLLISDYNFKGNIGDYFSGYAGNGSDRGKTNSYRFANLNDYYKGKVDNFGILMPNTSAFTGVSALDANNFLRRTETAVDGGPLTQISRPWIGFYGNYAPFTLGLAINAVDIATTTPLATGSISRAAGTIRFSGTKIADLVTFDVLYRFAGSDLSTDKNKEDNTTTPPTYGTPYGQPDGTGTGEHNFGLYAGLDPIPGLGVSVGYTGYFKTYEDEKQQKRGQTDPDVTETITYSSPLYSGVDLRAAYTGIDKLTITLQNNVSFASAKGTDPAGTEVNYGIANINALYRTLFTAGSAMQRGTNTAADYAVLIEKDSQSWFALYNALGLKYKLTDQLTADFQIGNNRGKISGEVEGPDAAAITAQLSGGALGDTVTGHKYAKTVNVFSAALSAAYAFNSHVTISSGLSARYTSTTYEAPTLNRTKYNAATTAADYVESATYSTGTFEFAIPIYFKIVY